MTVVKRLGSFAVYIVLAGVLVWGFTSVEQPVYSLFQSAVSPVEVPTNTPVPPPPPTNTPQPPPPTNTPEPAPTDTPAPAPTDTPVPEQVEQPEQPAPTDTPVPAEPTEPPAEEFTPSPTPLVNTIETTEPLTATLPQPLEPQVVQPNNPPVESPPAESPAVAEDSQLVINQVELIDTIVKWLAYGWICVGAGFILLALIFFPLLQIRGAHLKRSGK